MLRSSAAPLCSALSWTALLQAACASTSVSTAAARGFASDSAVVEIKNDAQFETVVKKAKAGSLAVVDFTAVWCGPCRVIAPIYEQLSSKHPEVTFTKVDIDNPDVAGVVQEHGITGVPTFTFYKDGKKIDGFSGVQREKLLQLIEQHK